MSDDKPVPIQANVDRLYRTGGIVPITILFAGIFSIGLPQLTGGGGADVRGTPAAEVTSIPYTITVPATRPILTGTGIPAQVSDALAPKPTQTVPPGQEAVSGSGKIQ